MAHDQDPGSDQGSLEIHALNSPERYSARQGSCRLAARALAGLCWLLSAGAAPAHWLSADEIVAGLRQNEPLRARAGITDIRRDPNLSRLLIIAVRRAQWDTLPGAERLALAKDWYTTWRHNVDSGIVAVIDADSGKTVVNYNGIGEPALIVHPPTAAKSR